MNSAASPLTPPAPPVALCPGCGKPVPVTASESLCSACLLAGALDWAETGESAEPAEEAPGRCGDYELLEEIGRGGMGVVYRARQAGLQREVALKMLPAAGSSAPEGVRRFRLEAEVIARLDHPHIVTLYTLGDEAGQPYFVMKLAGGGSLAGRLAEKAGGFPPREAAQLVSLISRAVHHAHGHGVLHRDLKPANILLESDGTPLVSDFGLARLAHDAAGLTLTGSALGTPSWMAPEQAAGAEAATTASDIYSLGAILYHLLTGRAPFTGTGPLEVLQQVMRDDPVPPRFTAPEVAADLSTICLKCLEKSPARRYPSAAALADDLDRWLAGEPVMARPAGAAERLWKWARRHPATAALLVAAVIGAVIVAVILAGGNVLLRTERNKALEQAEIALAGTKRATASEDAMRLNVYAADMFLACRALEDGHLGAARTTLNRHLPRPGTADLRGYEWYALERQCRGDDLRILAKHGGAVHAVAFSPDGKLAATGGSDGMLHIWNAADGSAVQTLPEKPDTPTVQEFITLAALPVQSPESIAALTRGTNPASIRMRARPNKLGPVRAIAWSPDGKWLVTTGSGTYVRLWRTADWKLHGFIPLERAVQAAFTPDSQRIVLAVEGMPDKPGDAAVLIYATATLAREETIAATVPQFALARDEPVLATALGSTVRLRNLVSQATHEWVVDHSALHLAISPDAGRVAILGKEGGSLRDAASGVAIAGLVMGAAPGYAVAFSPDGSVLAAGGAGQMLHFFDGHTGARHGSLRGHDSEIYALAAQPRTGQFLTGSSDATARLWPAPGESAPAETTMTVTHTLDDATPDGDWLLGTRPDGTVSCQKWNAPPSGHTPGDAKRRGLAIVAGGPDGPRYLTAREGTATLEWWSAKGLPTAGPIELGEEPGVVLTVCPAAGWVAVSRRKAPISLHHWETGALLATLPKAPINIVRLTASADGRYLCVLEYPRTAALFDTATSRWIWSEHLTPGTLGPVVFSPDARYLASAGSDAIITVRETTTGQIAATLRGHFSEVKALAFSPDGRTLVSSSADLTLRLWHTPTWRELGPLRRGILSGRLLFVPQGLLAAEYEKRWLLLPGASLP